MLRCQFLCRVLKTLCIIKIALKLSYFCKKMQNFQALGAPIPDPKIIPPPSRIFHYAPAHKYEPDFFFTNRKPFFRKASGVFAKKLTALVKMKFDIDICLLYMF